MKKYLQLLIVLVLTCLLSSSTYYTAEYPNAAMHSTSAMTSCGSSLPCAASAGFVSADDNLSEGSNDLPSGPRRIRIEEGNVNQGDGPENPDDPWKTPIGDIPLGMMVVCILIYMYVIYRKSINIPADRS
jgi:hypothetical protein